MVVSAGVRLVGPIQRLSSKEGSFCLVAVRFDDWNTTLCKIQVI